MAQGNWFGPVENVSSGWPAPPQYNAPNIGGLVGDILRNRLAQQINTQNQFKTLGQQIQAQRQNEAFGEQASNAGLLPGVDTSDLNAQQIALLAKTIQSQGSAAAMDEYRRKLGTAVTTRANAYAADKNAPDDGSGAPATPETYTDPNTGLTWARRPGGKWQLLPKYGQRGTAEPGTGENAPSLEPQVITPDDSTAPADQGTPPPADVTPTPIPYDQTIPTEPARVPPNSAKVGPGAGWPISDRDQEALVWAQGHPDDPRAAAILQRLGIQ